MNPIGNQSRSKIGFADLYLERYGSGPVEGLPEPDPDLFLIVTIPAFKEPGLTDSLNALLACDPPGVMWEILININYPENSGADVVEISRQSMEAVKQLSSHLSRSDVRIHCLWNPDMPVRHAGVGLARKIVMDQAVRRFNSIGRPEGVILSFDADSSCEKGYLNSIKEFYVSNPGVRTANIYFEHPLSGSFDPRIYHSIAQYELYLRYMRLAIEKTGHPHAIYTVGSSFSLRSKTYIRANGMGRHKAGEDFYFLHKCIQLKGFWEINETAVYPSVRESDRVSFGTGASIHRMQNDPTLEVYDFDSFLPLQRFFSKVGDYWQPTSPCPLLSKEGVAPREVPGFENFNLQLEDEWEGISTGLAGFLKMQKAVGRIQEMRRDSASEQTFRDKFFAWFNGFMVLRYLNDVHKDQYVKMPVLHEASRLALILGINSGESAEELLVHFRDFERGRGNRRII
ncbi:MAG: hypothetical protein NTV01_03110 [Bacteroidia bacterium]|nr:hypothetical protein [Bacteroidia bacterium]